MDRFDTDPSCMANGILMCEAQLNATDLPNYYAYADNFVLGDNHFTSLHATSFPESPLHHRGDFRRRDQPGNSGLGSVEDRSRMPRR